MEPKMSAGTTAATFTQHYKAKLTAALETIDLQRVDRAIELISRARERNATIFVCGNGGSAATASHFVTDMLKSASYDRAPRFRIMALTDSIATITAYSNDVGYDCIFAEQLKNFARPGDVLMAISGSGNSPNVICVMESAKALGCETIALTGRDGGRLGPLADIDIRVADQHMGRIEDGHLIVCHMMCYYFVEE